MPKVLDGAILDEYDEHHVLYEDFRKRVEGLINDLLASHQLIVHTVESRLKTRSSLESKLSKNQGEIDSKYADLADITDIVGLRIITYFDTDVDRVARMIEGEFDIDRSNCSDKREMHDPDRFGYLSLHYVALLSGDRLKHSELKKFNACKFEVQIRSMLQHAWAEIEHDLGYKSSVAVPKHLRRRFSRLAGLLEMADDEFTRIRKELKEYEQAVVGKVERNPKAVSVDQASIAAFALNDEMVKELDQRCASTINASLVISETLFAALALRVRLLGMETIGDLQRNLAAHEDIIPKYFASFRKMVGELPAIVCGASIQIMCQIVAMNVDEASRNTFLATLDTRGQGRVHYEHLRHLITKALLDAQDKP